MSTFSTAWVPRPQALSQTYKKASCLRAEWYGSIPARTHTVHVVCPAWQAVLVSGTMGARVRWPVWLAVRRLLVTARRAVVSRQAARERQAVFGFGFLGHPKHCVYTCAASSASCVRGNQQGRAARSRHTGAHGARLVHCSAWAGAACKQGASHGITRNQGGTAGSEKLRAEAASSSPPGRP